MIGRPARLSDMRARTRSWMMCTTLAVAVGAGFGLRAGGDVVLSHRVEKIEAFISDGGARQARLVPVEQVYEGDELRYTITFTNDTDETVGSNSIVVTNPIPESTEYIEGSAFGSASKVEFSADGGKSFAAPGALTVRDGERERRAQPRDYTTIRWHYGPPLSPGERNHVSFVVRMR